MKQKSSFVKDSSGNLFPSSSSPASPPILFPSPSQSDSPIQGLPSFWEHLHSTNSIIHSFHISDESTKIKMKSDINHLFEQFEEHLKHEPHSQYASFIKDARVKLHSILKQ